jgi:hypothetical protein
MVDEAGLRVALGRLVPAGSSRQREFVVRDGAGRMRIGVLCTDAGVYVEVANFAAASGGLFRDYVSPWGEMAGVFRFGCDVDLFYSDIEQTMTMSQAAAERALAAAGAG